MNVSIMQRASAALAGLVLVGGLAITSAAPAIAGPDAARAASNAIPAGGLALLSPATASAGQGAAPTAAAVESSRPWVACYLYVSDRFGYYNVRTSKSATATLIVKYTGTRLPVWDRCGGETGGSYRCTSTDPADNWWQAVN